MEQAIKDLLEASNEKLAAQKAVIKAEERRMKAHYHWLQAKDALRMKERELMEDFEINRHGTNKENK